MTVIAEQEAVPPNTPPGFWSPAISESQALQVVEMVTAHNWEALQLPLIILVATFNHQRTFRLLSRLGWYIQEDKNDSDLRPETRQRILPTGSRSNVDHQKFASYRFLSRAGAKGTMVNRINFVLYKMLSSLSWRIFWGLKVKILT